jgi:hypothetical protein
MAGRPDRMAAAAFERDWPARASTVALVLLPSCWSGWSPWPGRAACVRRRPSRPSRLAGGAQTATTAQLTDSAAAVLTQALSDGAGRGLQLRTYHFACLWPACLLLSARVPDHAGRALIAVREGGELRALWDETDDAEEWRTRLMDLEARLN